jgi:hypothetical protein
MSEWFKMLQTLFADPTPAQIEGSRVSSSKEEEDEKFVAALWASTETSVEFTDELVDELTRPVRQALNQQLKLGR